MITCMATKSQSSGHKIHMNPILFYVPGANEHTTKKVLVVISVIQDGFDAQIG